MTWGNGVLYVIVCASGAAGDVGRLVRLARDEGWTVQIVATPPALDFIDVPALERQTGRPVRSRYRRPDEPKPPRADAIIVAPATFNTINKFALGIADTYALGLLAEAPGLGIPVVVLPFVNDALASRVPFRRSVESLRAEGVSILPGPGQDRSGPPAVHDRTGDPEDRPWARALDALGRLRREAPGEVTGP
ncbi:flavoprotein [Streptosporangium sandarakinum]|uniref:Phosphopantothenoylcysteine synthetase/decarboxylase n=1 Tax=Streptosporangium sandarakinum TaxID=1260955 RepID=A0A852UWR6_9ACTN|nr:flavoprotein [Streptosporangium sandarakinum]NYF40370.1 phosphopantothenoylcysteine synthetase/decarboxylase [Streptosporangium sandarakinum]